MLRLFQAGEIAEAVLAFQSNIAKHPEDCSESWRMLGSCHQEQDEDRRAITCLEKAVEQDPYNLDALLSLGVSYVNELDSTRSLKALKAWVSHNPKFQGMEVVNDGYVCVGGLGVVQC